MEDMTVENLLKGLIPTESLIFEKGMFGENEYNDQTLPFLRNKMEGLNWVTVEENKGETTRKWLKENRDPDERNLKNRAYYSYLVDVVGVNPADARKMRKY